MHDRPPGETGPLIRHYQELLREHSGAAAVGWRTSDVQQRNFASVAQVFSGDREPFSVHEVGCGLGHFADFLEKHYPRATYHGSDIVIEMAACAKERRADLDVRLHDILSSYPPEADYVIESGIFNLRIEQPEETWRSFVRRMLRAMYAFARKGIAANFLTSHVDWKRELGYYENPADILTFAIEELSRFAEIRHAYYPWEFTLLVYREPQALRFAPPPVAWPPSTRERTDPRSS